MEVQVKGASASAGNLGHNEVLTPDHGHRPPDDVALRDALVEFHVHNARLRDRSNVRGQNLGDNVDQGISSSTVEQSSVASR
jgi:hypothetical protein